MSETSIFSSCRTIFTMCRLHANVDASIRMACDIGIENATLLTDIAEHGSDGLPIKTIRERYEGFVDPDWAVETLIRRELVQRVRNQKDRRSLAITITSKGKERLLIVDDAIAHALLDLNTRMVEDDFVRLVHLTQDLAFRFSSKRQAVSLFPSFLLRTICRYRHILIHTAARYGMTAFQAAVLMRLNDTPDNLDFEGAKRYFLYSSNLLEAQLDSMTSHGLIEEINHVVLTEAGIARREVFQKDLHDALAARARAIPAPVLEQLSDVLEFTNYLFS